MGAKCEKWKYMEGHFSGCFNDYSQITQNRSSLISVTEVILLPCFSKAGQSCCELLYRFLSPAQAKDATEFFLKKMLFLVYETKIFRV